MFQQGTIANSVQRATDTGIPVFAFDIDALTPDVKMYTSWSDNEAGAMAVDELVTRARE